MNAEYIKRLMDALGLSQEEAQAYLATKTMFTVALDDLIPELSQQAPEQVWRTCMGAEQLAAGGAGNYAHVGMRVYDGLGIDVLIDDIWVTKPTNGEVEIRFGTTSLTGGPSNYKFFCDRRLSGVPLVQLRYQAPNAGVDTQRFEFEVGAYQTLHLSECGIYLQGDDTRCVHVASATANELFSVAFKWRERTRV